MRIPLEAQLVCLCLSSVWIHCLFMFPLYFWSLFVTLMIFGWHHMKYRGGKSFCLNPKTQNQAARTHGFFPAPLP